MACAADRITERAQSRSKVKRHAHPRPFGILGRRVAGDPAWSRRTRNGPLRQGGRGAYDGPQSGNRMQPPAPVDVDAVRAGPAKRYNDRPMPIGWVSPMRRPPGPVAGWDGVSETIGMDNLTLRFRHAR